ncbi:hypothetical protein CSUB01_05969 [Colletotrichum sublineola]|uniref:Methyltransferase domain-containing protein n=1 Tax=Colletotrichum sublineola TaxID=1173701 RepID=A0A066WVU4_COLSU|nr:hypothetical protein CSUB01_05969 [Colletotrichum sublineola]
MDKEKLKDGLDLLHNVILLARNGKLMERPPPPHGRILDDDTGTGIWAIEVAREVHEGEVLGFAASKLQPAAENRPANLEFRLGDRNTLWTLQDQFGLIHTRVLPADTRNWSEYYRMAYELLRIGGTLEIEALSLELSSDE